MTLKQQILDELGVLASFGSVDIPPGAPFETSAVITVLDTPLTYPTGDIDVSNYQAVAMNVGGTGSGISCLVEAGVNGLNLNPCYGWPIAGGTVVGPNFLPPLSVLATGQKNILYIFPVEYANIFRVQLRLQSSGTSYFGIGLLGAVPFIPGRNLTPKDYSSNWWFYAGAAGGITNTTAVTIKASAGTGLRNFLRSLQIINTAAVASEWSIRDGAGGTVLKRGYVPASMTSELSLSFDPPLKGTAATLLEFVLATTATVTLVNAQGWVGP